MKDAADKVCGRARYARRHGVALKITIRQTILDSEFLKQNSFMAILVDKDTRVIVQGLTGREGTFHAKASAAYGTKIVGGVTPGKGGTTHEGWPIFNTVQEAVDKTGANATVIFVPPPFAADAIMEAADAEIELIVCITEGIPALDMVQRLGVPAEPALAADRAELSRASSRPANAKSASCRRRIHKEGIVGIVSRSGTLTYEAVHQLTSAASGNRRRSGSAAIRSSARTLSMRSICSIGIPRPKRSL